MAEAESVGKIGLDLVVNDKQFNRQLSGITGMAKKAGKALAAAFGVKKLISFSKECLNLGSDLEEVQNVVDSTFTKMSSKVDKFAKDAMTSYGLSETMAKRYSGTLGAMAKAFGFSEKEAYDMGTTLTGLAGDVASFYNISQDEAYTKIKSVFTGETESLKDLGVVMTQTALDSYAMANGFGKTTSAMTEAEKVALRFKFVQDQLTTAAGDFARTSNSWANQVRILSLQFDSFRAAIGQGLINVLTPAIQLINVLMSRLVALGNAFKSFTGLFSGNKKAAESAKSIETSYKGAASASRAMAASGTKAANAVGKAAQKAAKKVRSLMGFDQINKVSDSEKESSGGNSGGGASGVGGTTGGASIDLDTGGSEEELKTLPKNYENLAKSIERFKKSCSGLSNVLSSDMKWSYDNVLEPLGKWTMTKLAPKVLDVFSGAVRVLTAAIKISAPIGKELWDDFLQPIAEFTGGAIIKFLGILSKGLNGIADFAEKHQKSLTQIAKGLLALFATFKAVSFITNAIGAIQAFSKGFIGVKTMFEGIFGSKSIIAKASGPISKLVKSFMLLPAPVKIAVAVMAALVAAGVLLYKNWDKIKKKLNPFVKWFKKQWNGLGKAVKNDIKIITGAIDKLKEAPEKIKEWFGEKLEDVEEWFSGIKESFDSTLEGLGENLPDLSEIGEKITEKVGEVKAKISGKLEETKDWWSNLRQGISDKIGEIKKKVSAVKDAAFDTVKGAWDAIKSGEASKTIKAIKDKGFDGVKKAYNSVKTKTATLTSKLKDKAGKSLTSLKKKWDNFKSKSVELTAKFKDVFTKPLKSAWNAIAGKINGAIDVINKVPGVNIKGRVPKLAQGGYVKKNTPQLAMIGDNRHQGEVVAPENKLEDMALKAAQMAAGGGNTEIISLLGQILAAILALSLTVNLDGKDITSNVIKRINDITKSTGKPPIIV